MSRRGVGELVLSIGFDERSERLLGVLQEFIRNERLREEPKQGGDSLPENSQDTSDDGGVQTAQAWDLMWQSFLGGLSKQEREFLEALQMKPRTVHDLHREVQAFDHPSKADAFAHALAVKITAEGYQVPFVGCKVPDGPSQDLIKGFRWIGMPWEEDFDPSRAGEQIFPMREIRMEPHSPRIRCMKKGGQKAPPSVPTREEEEVWQAYLAKQKPHFRFFLEILRKRGELTTSELKLALQQQGFGEWCDKLGTLVGPPFCYAKNQFEGISPIEATTLNGARPAERGYRWLGFPSEQKRNG